MHQRVTVLGVEAEGGEGGEIAARSDAHLEAVVAHQVEHGGVLGDAHRHLERQGDDAGAEPDARGARRRLGEEHERRRQAAFALVEMVLRDPRRIETAALGLLDLRQRQPVAFRGGGLVEQPGEEAQPLDRYLAAHRGRA